ncbi:uncharacterized protein LOC132200799 [Neocloeon triangulifer]|uniref:uncharacterized protein LOC132200799 n=1 Tax=Neocloeon triangulifer TaxID=2078957 RepID=UPI00286F884D|nr:uncharacterized protein LOC132200799 [Neocloeon triangulifer]
MIIFTAVMMKISIVALVAVLLSQQVFASDLFGDALARSRRAAQPKSCSWNSISKSFSCCTLPDAIPEAEKSSCLSVLKKKTKKGKDGKRIPGMSFACVLDCFLGNRSMLSSDGYANLEALENLFMEKADKVWQPIITEAFANCTARQKTAKITTEGECKMSNLHYAFCLYQFALTECPSTPKMNSKDTKKCQKMLKDVASCDPWEPLVDPSDKQSEQKAESAKQNKKN